MQFEPEKSTHCRAPPLGQPLERAIAADARIGTNRELGAVGHINASLLARQAGQRPTLPPGGRFCNLSTY
jgi:hypothetical protein